VMPGNSSGLPNWHQPTAVSPSNTRAACASPAAQKKASELALSSTA
jgi:hypothetical protein